MHDRWVPGGPFEVVLTSSIRSDLVDLQRALPIPTTALGRRPQGRLFPLRQETPALKNAAKSRCWRYQQPSGLGLTWNRAKPLSTGLSGFRSGASVGRGQARCFSASTPRPANLPVTGAVTEPGALFIACHGVGRQIVRQEGQNGGHVSSAIILAAAVIRTSGLGLSGNSDERLRIQSDRRRFSFK